MANPDLDPQLLEGLRKGDREAQSIFWEKFHDYLYFRVVMRHTRSREDAEEIVADICLRVFECVGNFQGRSRFTTWLHTVISKVASDYYRSRKNRFISSGAPLDEIDEEGAPSEGNFQKGDSTPLSGGRSGRPVVKPDDTELNKQITIEHKRHLEAALQKLPLDHYKVILCRRINGYSVERTAEEMDRSEAAVKMLYMRARETLEKILSEDPYFSISKKGEEKSESPS